MTTTSIATLRERLTSIFVDVNEGRLPLTPEQFETPLQEVGLDSVGLLRFLVAIEDALGIEWSLDVPRHVFRSIASIADYLDTQDQMAA